MKLRWKRGQFFSAFNNIHLLGKKPAWMTSVHLKGAQKKMTVKCLRTLVTHYKKKKYIFFYICIIEHCSLLLLSFMSSQQLSTMQLLAHSSSPHLLLSGKENWEKNIKPRGLR